MGAKHAKGQTKSCKREEPEHVNWARSPDVKSLEGSLKSWREVVLVMDDVLAWREDWHPAVIAGTLTTVYTLIRYYDPNYLTMFCLAGMFVSLANFLIPNIIPLVFGDDSWNGAKQKQLGRVYEDLWTLGAFFAGVSLTFYAMYTGMSLAYPGLLFAVTVAILLVIYWVGPLFSGFFLVFCLSMAVLMLHGLRSRGLLDKYCSGLTNKAK